MFYTKTTWTKGDVITAEKLNKIESGIEQAGSGGSGEFDFKAFCQEWSPIIAAEGLGPEVQIAMIQAMNEFPQNISIHCSGILGSDTIVADEDYGDIFPLLLSTFVTMGRRSVTLVVDMLVDGATLRVYFGPLFLDNNSDVSGATYYELKPDRGKWCSYVYIQDGREFTNETTKFLVWEEEEPAHFEAQ